MAHTLEKLKKKCIIGIELRTTNEDDRYKEEIPKHWERFFLERIQDQIPNKLNQNILALYTDYESDHTKPYSLIIGSEVSSCDDSSVPKGCVKKNIPETSYAVFTAKGKFPESMLKTWGEIWSSKIKRAYTNDFELYPVNFDPMNNPEIKIYISIRP